MTHIDAFNHETLQRLASHQSDLCLTITMPTFVTGKEVEQNHIRFKNCIQEAREKLEKIGWNEDRANEFLKPLFDETSDHDYWHTQGEGLLVCLSENICEFYRLDMPLEENVILDRHFYLRAVIPALQNQQRCVMMLLSQDHPRIVTASYAANEAADNYHVIEPPEDVKNFDKFLQVFDFEESLQFGKRNSSASHSEFHGHGGAGDEANDKKYLEEYYKQLDNWVRDLTADHHINEIFLIAEDQNQGLYQKSVQDGHPDIHVLASKNPDSKSEEEWIELARDAMQQRQRKSQLALVEEYQKKQQTAPDALTDDLGNIVKAAHNKRIETLIIPESSEKYIWGRFNEQTQDVELQQAEEQQSGVGDELLNLAALQTYLNGGTVCTMPANENMPKPAAICRW